MDNFENIKQMNIKELAEVLTKFEIKGFFGNGIITVENNIKWLNEDRSN